MATKIYTTLHFVLLCVIYELVLLPCCEHSEKEYFLLVTHDAQFIYSGACAYAWAM